MSLSNKTFVTQITDPASSTLSAVRRVFVNQEIIKTCKAATGDVVVITAADVPKDQVAPAHHFLV